MKAATTRRPCLPAWASTLRMKCTRQRCQEAFRTLATAAFRPSWASETTSLTPRRPRRASLRRKSVQKTSASEVPIAKPSTSRRPSLLTPTETMRPSRRLHVGGIQPDIGPIALQWPVEEGGDLAVNLAAQPADLALRDAGHAHRLDQFVDGAGRYALHVGLLDHCGQSLLGHPARLQESRKIAPLAQLRYAQLDRACAGLPVAIAVSIAVVDPLGAAFAMTSAGQPLDLPRHQTLCRKADHLAQQVDLGTLLQKRPKAHHLRGHRRVLGSVEGVQPNPTQALR